MNCEQCGEPESREKLVLPCEDCKRMLCLACAEDSLGGMGPVDLLCGKCLSKDCQKCKGTQMVNGSRCRECLPDSLAVPLEA